MRPPEFEFNRICQPKSIGPLPSCILCRRSYKGPSLSCWEELEGWEKYGSSRPCISISTIRPSIDARHIWSNSAIEIGSMNTAVCRMQATRMGPVSPFLSFPHPNTHYVWGGGMGWIHGHFFALTLSGDSDFYHLPLLSRLPNGMRRREGQRIAPTDKNSRCYLPSNL